MTEGPTTCDVTVIIPAFNRSRTIRRAVESALTQSLPPRRIIVIDDGSDDGTAEVATAAGADVVSLPTSMGAGPARNLGIESATTEYIAFLDSDDAWTASHLELSVPAVQDYGFTTAAMIDSFGKLVGNTTGRAHPIGVADLFFPSNQVCTSAVVCKRSLVIAAGLFRPLRRAQDLDLWVRILKLQGGLALGHTGAHYALESAYPKQELRAKNRSGLQNVITNYDQDDWLTPALAQQIATKLAWDDFRYAVHSHDTRGAGIAAASLISRPRRWPPLVSLLRYRRNSRSSTNQPS